MITKILRRVKMTRPALLTLPALATLVLAAALSSRALATGGGGHDHATGYEPIHAGMPGTQPPGAFVTAVRAATDRFHDVLVAQAEDYAPQFSCVSGPDFGAMGIHFVNFAFVTDGVLDVAHPESVIYEPTRDGRLKIVGVEFLVLKAQWDATHAGPPEMMGQLFHLTTEPNRYGLPAFYSLHVWAWRDNPLGAFVNWHPTVSCQAFSGQPGVPDPGLDGHD